MRVWLDDERDPTDPVIQKKFGSQGDEVWVKTVAAAIELLNTHRVKWMSLDNDLGAGQDEGYKVADWIEKESYHGRLFPPIVVVHSANVARRGHMEAAIRNARKFWGR